MKKNGLFILGLLFSIIFSVNTNLVSASAQTIDDEYTTYDGLGCGIDAKNTKSIAYSDLIYTHSIFNNNIEKLRRDSFQTNQEKEIENWYNSINRDSCVYVNLAGNGILPIWSFVTDSSLADTIKKIFNIYVKGETAYSDNVKYQARHDGDIRFGPGNNNYVLDFDMPYSPMLIECGYNKMYFKMSLYLWTLNQLINNLDVYIRNKNDVSLVKKTIHMTQKNAKLYTIEFDVINLTEESLSNSINLSYDTCFDIKLNFDVKGQFFQTHGASKIALDLEYRK